MTKKDDTVEVRLTAGKLWVDANIYSGGVKSNTWMGGPYWRKFGCRYERERLFGHTKQNPFMLGVSHRLEAPLGYITILFSVPPLLWLARYRLRRLRLRPARLHRSLPGMRDANATVA